MYNCKCMQNICMTCGSVNITFLVVARLSMVILARFAHGLCDYAYTGSLLVRGCLEIASN